MKEESNNGINKFPFNGIHFTCSLTISAMCLDHIYLPDPTSPSPQAFSTHFLIHFMSSLLQPTESS